MELKTILVTQARMGSSRLPGKVAKEIQGESLLKIHLNRIQKAKSIDKIIVATTTNQEDEVIYSNAISWGFDSYRGSEDDVLDRYYQAVNKFKPQWVVRVTSDCPLIDADLVDKVIAFAQENEVDYCSNGFVENYPDGQDVEVFKFSALESAWKNAKLSSEREHVTPYIRSNSDFKGGNLFSAINYPCESDFSKIRMTVDESRDFELIEILINCLGKEKSWLEYTNYIIEKDLSKINSQIIRNEGLLKSLKNDK
jgi:spore coat polysaccharide biosynthesis protein SpsF